MDLRAFLLFSSFLPGFLLGPRKPFTQRHVRRLELSLFDMVHQADYVLGKCFHWTLLSQFGCIVLDVIENGAKLFFFALLFLFGILLFASFHQVNGKLTVAGE